MPRWFPVVFLGVGLACLLAAGLTLARERAFAASALSVEGTVIELVPVHSSTGSSTLYAPVFRFTTRDGRVIRIHSSSRSSPPAYEVGARVPLLYDAERPEKAVEDTFLLRHLASLILAGIGLPFTVAGIGLLRAFRSPAAATPPRRTKNTKKKRRG